MHVVGNLKTNNLELLLVKYGLKLSSEVRRLKVGLSGNFANAVIKRRLIEIFEHVELADCQPVCTVP